MKDSIFQSIQQETAQGPPTRIRLFRAVEKELGRKVISLFTSFQQPVQLDDSDADMIHDLLQRLDLTKGLALIIGSPGGDGLAAERIVNICRAFSGTGEFHAIVPSKAKSAATIVCMGASKIFMGPSSELGPVDPQVVRKENEVWRTWSAYDLVSSYDALFKGAVAAQGHIEPFLQQLGRYDARDIATYRSQIALSEDVAVKILKTGMLTGSSDDEIRKKIKPFLDPASATKVHARPIYSDQAAHCGLVIESMDIKKSLWKSIYEIYMRSDWFVNRSASKAIECSEGSFFAPHR